MNAPFSILCFLVMLTLIGCKSDKKLTGVYKTSEGDTLRLVEDHSFRIELMEPDTVQLHQFKISTGRWSVVKGKLQLTMDSRSMGQYWECQPFRIGWRRLRRPVQCEEKGEVMVFKKVKMKKTKKRNTEEEEEKKPKKKKKKKEKDEE
jgi:hypothetical protein